MNASSLDRKTIRPGSLGSYSYYHSARRPLPAPKQSAKAKSAHPGLGRKIALTLAVLVALIGLPLLRPFSGNESAVPNSGSGNKLSTPAAASVATVAPNSKKDNHCAANSHDKFILISVSQRHLWACQGNQQLFDTPVITGMTSHPETLTPPGTYKIYAKQTDTTLKGSDSTGSWRVPVSYWMPFLDNQHGTYGFHDATWRGGSAFGNVDPASDKASHGCVELPLAASHWLYDWANTHTVVKIEN